MEAGAGSARHGGDIEVVHAALRGSLQEVESFVRHVGQSWAWPAMLAQLGDHSLWRIYFLSGAAGCVDVEMHLMGEGKHGGISKTKPDTYVKAFLLDIVVLHSTTKTGG